MSCVSDAQRIFESAAEAVAVLLLVRGLNRRVRIVVPGPSVVDGAEAAIGTQQIGGERRRAGNRTGSERRILILREIGRSEVRTVQVQRVVTGGDSDTAPGDCVVVIGLH